MKITFVLPALSLAGGIRIAALYADWLARHGHDVTVVHGRPRAPSLRERLRALGRGRDEFFRVLEDTPEDYLHLLAGDAFSPGGQT